MKAEYSVREYVATFAGLLGLTVVTVGASFLPTPQPFHSIIAMAIATLKAILVVGFFMHVFRSTAIVRLALLSGFFWLSILILFMFVDQLSRTDRRVNASPTASLTAR